MEEIKMNKAVAQLARDHGENADCYEGYHSGFFREFDKRSVTTVRHQFESGALSPQEHNAGASG